jgi:GH15 family glucan-1,4-alpha-glucosidase
MAYLPIEDYGIIGDLHTVALVGVNGSIDWLCFPSFDSPSIFAAILDDKKGGRFKISPTNTDGLTCKQFYWPDTNVLVTRFLSEEGVAELTDYMPIDTEKYGPGDHTLIRKLVMVRGEMKFDMECSPRFNYARDKHDLSLQENGARFTSDDLSISLSSETPVKERDGGLFSEFTLQEDDTAVFVLQKTPEDESSPIAPSDEEAEKLFQETVDYWRNWLKTGTYTGRWREIVNRSALTLKLLTYEPTGAIVASPTTSLPEQIGAGRNWDYRYTWIRDAAFTVYALLRIGFTEEARLFMEWITERCAEPHDDRPLQLVYTIRGDHEIPEEELSHLEGYRGSSPVRIGNNAYSQLQLDIYGELMDSVYLFNKYVTPISYDLWKNLSGFMDYVCDNWDRKDEGIWEVRSGKQHFVYSKLMCWVALDRAIRLAEKRSFPAPVEKWRQCRDDIYRAIMKDGYDEDMGAFVQYFNCDYLDASNLMMPLVFFVSPTDPRMIGTVNAINRPPDKGGLVSSGLVYRYNVEKTQDGLLGEEGTFNICTFWLVEALTRSGRLDEARLMFEKMMGFANHLGLFSEETGPAGEALGNFPQAFTHLSLISAAFNLDRALDGK